MPSPTPQRARLPIDERRKQLLELGMRLFCETSYDALSIDDIAAAAGISKGLLYHYFGSKRGFYVATVEAAAAHLLSVIHPDVDVPADQRARMGITAYIDFVDQHDAAYATLMRGGIGSDAEVLEIIESTRSAIVDRTLETIGVGARSPVFRLALRGWVGFAEGASLDWLDGRDVPRATLAALLFASLTAAIGTAASLDPVAAREMRVGPDAG